MTKFWTQSPKCELVGNNTGKGGGAIPSSGQRHTPGIPSGLNERISSDNGDMSNEKILYRYCQEVNCQKLIF
jgi:hypothetical protein